MNKVKKTIVSSIIGISLFAPAVLNMVNVAHADKTDSNGYVTYGHAPSWAKKSDKDFFDEDFKDGEKAINKSNKEWKKQSDKFSKTHDKNIQYDLNGNIPKDKDNITVAKQYKKELPKLEQQLKSLKKNSKQYNALNHKIQIHKTVINAIFGK